MKTTTTLIALLLLSAIPLSAVSGDASEGETSAAVPTTSEADGIRTIYLIRHGNYDYDEGADPDIGKALVPLGIAQARLTASRLRGLPVEIDSIHASTMTRARQTARIIGEDFPHLEIQQTRILRECTPTTWREDIMAGEEPDVVAACEAQLEKAFEEFFIPSPDKDRTDIIVCHGNVIRYLVTRSMGVDPHAWLTMSVGNCSITRIRITPDGKFKILGVGDLGHLPPNMQTGSYDEAGPLVVPVNE